MAIELATMSTDVARPLHVLVPLIKADLKQAGEAAKNAALPYFAAAGEKMIEARTQMKATEFDSWTKRNFNVGIRQANEYMNYARHNSDSSIVANVTTLRQVIHTTRNNPNYGKPASWQSPVREAIGRVDINALKQAALAREAERALQRKLSLSLIDIGYKALASKLHPDKGGSAEAMTRLNRVREILKKAVTA
jgi:ATP phosphoribosyltransferase regulatory subunit HisZ